MKVTVLVATMSGTAEFVAEKVVGALKHAGHDARVVMMDEIAASTLSAGGLFLLCMSTYDLGTLPDNAVPLVEELERERPDLSAMRYGLFALGDSVYAETFCAAADRVDELLQALGANRSGDIAYHDAASPTPPEDVAPGWALSWMASI